MTTSVADQVIRKIADAHMLYHRMVLIVGTAGSGKTVALQAIATSKAAPFINVNLELSRRMLELTQRQRILLLPQLLSEIVNEVSTELVLLDNIEILFDIHLKQNPLRVIKGLSRNRTVVAAWNGSIVDDYITYAGPEHSEYRRYPIRDLLVVRAGATCN